jgi:Domain of unknown function (DUF1707)
MAGPGDEMAAGAGGQGHLRASHADREQVIGVFKAAFVQGMVAKDEFDARVGQALASRTYAELAKVTAGLPAGLPHAVPPRPASRAQARRPMSKAAKAGIYVAIAIAVPVVLAFATGAPIPFFMFPPFYLMVAVVEMYARRLEKRSRAQLPKGPAPGTGGPASQRPVSADPGRQLPPAGHERTAEAARWRPPRLLPQLARSR